MSQERVPSQGDGRVFDAEVKKKKKEQKKVLHWIVGMLVVCNVLGMMVESESISFVTRYLGEAVLDMTSVFDGDENQKAHDQIRCLL